MKKNNRISDIIKRYLSARFSSKTEEKVQQWLIKDENREEKESASLEYWDSLEESSNSEIYSALDRVNQRIGYTQKQTIKVPLYKRLSRVAAVLIPLLIIAGGYFYYQSTQSDIIEIKVAYGEEKHLFLPDSSEIWINSGSIVKYPKEFSENQRLVQLSGEAYFSVRRDESKPFIVKTENLSVNVLGTKFNVKAYSNEERIITTLTSGKVEIILEKQSQILKPNEQLTYNKVTATTNIKEISPKETNVWLTGQLIFNNSSLSEILQTLERRFNISITNNTEIPITKQYTVKFLKNENLEEILDILHDVVGFNYQIDGNQIVLIEKL
ncbi:FecR family protein [Parabacteroides sp. Marseille-P3160]|uniref:FecR family protein n=1 Tax=Parabacteroides sp. Marseille-P3160 TaxID=1917887 RepID=UPI0009B94E84|nr:FecR family protein [Parabacteroides sp. Marseille-P3160]